MSTAIGTINELVSVIRITLGGAAPAAAPARRRERAEPAAIRTGTSRRRSKHGGSRSGATIRNVGASLSRLPRSGLVDAFGRRVDERSPFLSVLDDVQHALESDASGALLVKQADEQLLSKQSPEAPPWR